MVCVSDFLDDFDVDLSGSPLKTPKKTASSRRFPSAVDASPEAEKQSSMPCLTSLERTKSSSGKSKKKKTSRRNPSDVGREMLEEDNIRALSSSMHSTRSARKPSRRGSLGSTLMEEKKGVARTSSMLSSKAAKKPSRRRSVGAETAEDKDTSLNSSMHSTRSNRKPSRRRSVGVETVEEKDMSLNSSMHSTRSSRRPGRRRSVGTETVDNADTTLNSSTHGSRKLSRRASTGLEYMVQNKPTSTPSSQPSDAGPRKPTRRGSVGALAVKSAEENRRNNLSLSVSMHSALPRNKPSRRSSLATSTMDDTNDSLSSSLHSRRSTRTKDRQKAFQDGAATDVGSTQWKRERRSSMTGASDAANKKFQSYLDQMERYEESLEQEHDTLRKELGALAMEKEFTEQKNMELEIKLEEMQRRSSMANSVKEDDDDDDDDDEFHTDAPDSLLDFDTPPAPSPRMGAQKTTSKEDQEIIESLRIENEILKSRLQRHETSLLRNTGKSLRHLVPQKSASKLNVEGDNTSSGAVKKESVSIDNNKVVIELRSELARLKMELDEKTKTLEQQNEEINQLKDDLAKAKFTMEHTGSFKYHMIKKDTNPSPLRMDGKGESSALSRLLWDL